MLWTQKHKPRIENVPQNTKQLREFIETHPKQKKKAIFLYGPTGTGKTAAVCALAEHYSLELSEINASDYRNADEINLRVGNALKQQSLFSKGKLILVDEVDAIAGNEDRGGVAALAELITNAKYPTILVANEPWEQKLNTLRKKSTLIEFKDIGIIEMLPALKKILEAEGIKADEEVLKILARRSGGDLRGAITDMQTLAESDALTAEGLEQLHERERSESIMSALFKILKSTEPNVALKALELVEEDTDECFLWIDENLPKEYKNPEELARAYTILSKADIYRGRIRKWQYWRYLAYVNILLTAGIASAKEKKPEGFADYTRSTRLLKRWMANQKYAKRKQVAQKLAMATHCSFKKALQETLPYLQMLYKQKHPSAEAITEELKLDEDEAEWLKTSNAVLLKQV